MNEITGNFPGFVFGIEICLTVVLVAWLRLSQRGTKEPWSFLITIIFYGGIVALLAAFVEIRYSFNIPALQDKYPLLVEKFGLWYEIINNLAASMIEELGKYVIAVFFIINTKHFHKMSDAILYLILIGLGFSLMEDLIFFLNPQTNAGFRLLSFYLHSGTSALIGYSLGRFKFGLTGYSELIRAVIGAISLHFMYNLSATLHQTDLAFALTACITLYISLQIFILYSKALREEYQLEHQSKRIVSHRLLNLHAKS